MGRYIQTPVKTGKADYLVQQGGTEFKPTTFAEIPQGKTAICVIENGFFDTTAIAYSESEFKCFKNDQFGRPMRWILLDDAVAKQLEG